MAEQQQLQEQQKQQQQQQEEQEAPLIISFMWIYDAFYRSMWSAKAS